MLFHQRRHRLRQPNQRVRAHVQRDAETLARCLHEWVVELRLRRERGAVYEEVEPAELPIDRRSQLGDLLVARDVTRQEERLLERGGEIADVLFEPLARIGQRETRAGGSRCLGNRPGNRPLVGDADDEAVFPCEDGHWWSVPANSGRWSVLTCQFSRVTWIVCGPDRDGSPGG